MQQTLEKSGKAKCGAIWGQSYFISQIGSKMQGSGGAPCCHCSSEATQLQQESPAKKLLSHSSLKTN
jgi:hypothetical protein